MSKKVYILIKRISSKYFFGFEYSNEKFCLPYSDIEKTFIDLVYFNQKLSKELVEEFKKRLDMRKLKVYLKRYPKRISSTALKQIGEKN